MVPDSDVESCSSSSDFLEDAPKKRKRLPLITNGSEQIEQSGGKVSLTRTRRSWSQLCQFDTSTTSQTEVRTAMMSSAVSDYLGGGTPEPTGITYIYVYALGCMIYCSIKNFLASGVCHDIQPPGADFMRYNLGPWTQSTVYRSRKG